MGCTLCPRKCGANRETALGYCKMPVGIHVSKIMKHLWEEPCIGGTAGSGAIFFTGCTLGCVYCQNYVISALRRGNPITEDELSAQMLRLQDEGAVNIDLVTPTHFAPGIISAAALARKQGLNVPLVWNTSGYELPERIEALKDTVDIYLPDLKYYSSDLSGKYSFAPDYFEVASRALIAMQAQTGKPLYGPDGLLKKGVLVRHMVLPGARKDSLELLKFLKDAFGTEGIVLSLMSQYTPTYRANEFKEINRKITNFEYQSVLDAALDMGFDKAYMQQRSAADTQYIPDFTN